LLTPMCLCHQAV